MCICTTGNWALVLRRDYFNKVAGGVRQQEKLDAHSELVKIRYAVVDHIKHLPVLAACELGQMCVIMQALSCWAISRVPVSAGHSHEWTCFVELYFLAKQIACFACQIPCNIA